MKSFSKRLVLVLLLFLLLYLSLYTWNLKTGVLDRFIDATGLQFTGLLLKPGQWAHSTFADGWKRYLANLDAQDENQRLKDMLSRMAVDMASLREDSARARRLEQLLDYAPPSEWERSGARVIAHEFGPAGVLETVMLDRGAATGVVVDSPVITPTGAVGRVVRSAGGVSTVLLLTDPGSRIAVRGEVTRTMGVLTGQGRGMPLLMRYVPLYDPIEEGEVLVTSGLAGVFPAGIPAARVTRIERLETSLFKNVYAEPLVVLQSLEDVLVLRRQACALPGPEAPSEAPSAGKDGEKAPDASGPKRAG